MPQKETSQSSQKRKHKGKRTKSKQKSEDWTIFYSNAQGLKSKRSSLIDIFEVLKPQVALISETQLATNAGIKIEGYTFFGRAREHKAGGGVGIFVDNEIKGSAAPHTSSRGIEILWISVKRRNACPAFIGVYYGKQESEGRKEDIESEFSDLTEEVIEMQNEGEVLLFMDANAKIGLMGEAISRNGKLLIQMISETSLQVVNKSQKCKGLITRQNRKKPQERSAIDLLLTSHNAEEWIQGMSIDEDGDYRTRGKNESDHNSIIVKVAMKNFEHTRKDKITIWNLKAKQEKWDKFQELLEEEGGNLQNIMATEDNLDQRYEKWTGTINKCAMKSIGKTTIKEGKRQKFSDEVTKLRKKRREVRNATLQERDITRKTQLKQEYIGLQGAVRNQISKENAQKLEERLEKVRNTNNFWKERKKLKKDNTLEWMITKDGRGKRIYDPEENKENIASYYEELYKKQVVQHHQYHEEVKENIQKLELDRNHEDQTYNTVPTLTEVEEAIAKKKNGKATTDFKNEMIKKGGKAMAQAIMPAIEAFWREEQAPARWNEGILSSIWKGKGDRESLKNHRGITVSSCMGTIPEVILNERFIKNMTLTQAQAGGRKNCSTGDHIFIIRAMIQYALATRKRIILTFYDVAKAFDHAEVDDMFHMVWKGGIKGKIWRLGKRLQEKLTSKVKTRYGHTRTIKRDSGGKQGGHIMPTIFCKMMDTLAEELLAGKSLGAFIKEEHIPAILFVDDVVSTAEGEQDQEKVLEKVADFAIKHKMEWGVDKCKVLEIGRHRNPRPHWKLGQKIIDGAEDYKYLGDIITRTGTNGKNLEERKLKVMKTLRAVKSCARDEVMSKVQNQAMLRLHEMVVIPTLLANAESWTLTKTDEIFCERIEAFALKKIYGLPMTFPTVALVHVTGTLLTSIRIDKKKLMFLHKILTREEGHWTTHMLQTLDQMNIGWAENIKGKLADYKLETDWQIIKRKTTGAWKMEVKEATEKKHKERMLQRCHEEDGQAKEKTKHIIQHLSSDEYMRAPSKVLQHMDRNKARIILIARYRMLDCASNYSHKYGSKNCSACKKTDDENHRINGCRKSKEEQSWKEFLDIYQDNSDVLLHMAQIIAETWKINSHG